MFIFSALTPMEYVSQHVHVCSSSVQLYRRVFNLHREGATPAPAPEALQQDGQQLAEQPAAEPVDIASLDEEPRYMLGEVSAAILLAPETCYAMLVYAEFLIRI